MRTPSSSAAYSSQLFCFPAYAYNQLFSASFFILFYRQEDEKAKLVLLRGVGAYKLTSLGNCKWLSIELLLCSSFYIILGGGNSPGMGGGGDTLYGCVHVIKGHSYQVVFMRRQKDCKHPA